MRRGQIKVMVDARGTTKIQETLGDQIKVWTLEEWNKELKRRETAEKAAPKAKKVGGKKAAPTKGKKGTKAKVEPVTEEEQVPAGDGLIQEDTDED